MDERLKRLDRVLCAAVVLVCLVLACSLVHRGVAQARQARQETELATATAEELRLAAGNLERLELLLNSATRELRELDMRVPDSHRFGPFVTPLDTLMKEKEILLIQLEPLPMEKDRLFNRIPLNVVFQGSFTNVHSLIGEIERLSRTVVMERISIVGSEMDPQCRVTLRAYIYSR